jgi:hypothetical protein
MEKTAIKRVIYSNPVTTIIWDDGSKTQSRCDERDNFDELTGFMMCVFKKIMKHKDMRQMFDTFVYGDDKHYVKRDKVKQTNNVKKTNNTDWLTDILKSLENCTTIEDCLHDTKYVSNDMFDDIINDMTIIFKE